MFNVLLLGAGKIGKLISHLLVYSEDYRVYLADVDERSVRETCEQINNSNLTAVVIDVNNATELDTFLTNTKIDAIISGLPHFCNPAVAQAALKHNTHYFDLTEDVEVTRKIEAISAQSEKAFVPQCGLAPGFISIVTHDLMTRFDQVDTVKMRVGALPINPSNALKYSLTWSTDGLINEYGNVCYGIEEGQFVPLRPLEGHETIEVDGLLYEAFNTSGGLGSLADNYKDRVKTMNYKTMRYPGHCEKIRLLMNDLKLNHDRDTFKRILENAIPKTKQDVVIIYVAVTGTQNGELFEENYVKKIYPHQIGDFHWAAIQVTTAAGICAIVDLVLNDKHPAQGFTALENFHLKDFLNNRFGEYYS